MHGDQVTELLKWGQGAGLAVLIIAFWCLLCYLGSWMSGWRALARRYRSEQEFQGERWRFQSGKMRWNTNYANCLTLGANRDGLYLAVLFLFRVGQPPLYIPWNEIAVQQERRWFLWRTRFALGNETQIPLWINRRLGDRILEYQPAGAGTIQDVYARPGTDAPRKIG